MPPWTLLDTNRGYEAVALRGTLHSTPYKPPVTPDLSAVGSAAEHLKPLQTAPEPVPKAVLALLLAPLAVLVAILIQYLFPTISL